MRISARADYAVRAALELAAAEPGRHLTSDAIATAQGIPHRFLEVILQDLRREGVVASHRGARGGHRLARPPSEVTVADVVRAVDGPLVFVNSERPQDLVYRGPAQSLLPVWVAVRASVRGVLDAVTLADVVRGELPDGVRALVDEPGAWRSSPPPAEPDPSGRD